MLNKTRSIKEKEIEKKWYLIDADGIRLGKLATSSASILLGKSNVKQTSNPKDGDSLVIINSDKIDVHKKKYKKKLYRKHSGYIGGLKEISLEDLLKKDSTLVIKEAVKGMLPKTKLGRKYYKNLYIYSGSDHQQTAQKPQKVEITS